MIINIHDAKANLSKLVEAIHSRREREFVIAVNGTPAARLVPIEPKKSLNWGLLKGGIAVPDDIDGNNSEIERMFAGGTD